MAAVLSYLQARPATPVSAAQILHRSLAAMIVPRAGQVIHQVTINTSTRISTTSPESRTVTTDEWLRLATPDSADRVDLSISEDGRLVHYQVSDGRHTWTYVAQSNRVYEGPSADVQFIETTDDIADAKQLTLQPQNPTHFRSVVASALASHTAHLLGRQTVDGRPVYVIEYNRRMIPGGRPVPSAKAEVVPANVTVTLSVEASTYTVVRLEERSYASRGNLISDEELQVAAYQVLDPIDVPPHVFRFVPPTGATQVPVPPSPSKTAKP
ncbi:MAG: DUF2092 domain-containing protein [Chloroflexi bacterium]|nr:DUF2092 domain-containing protein [Chloroflexota bacterium]